MATDSTVECSNILGRIQKKEPINSMPSKLPLASRPFVLKPRTPSFQIYRLKPLKGDEIQVEMDDLASIKLLKEKAVEALCLSNPPKLLFKGKALQNYKALLDYTLNGPITVVTSTEVKEADPIVITEQEQLPVEQIPKEDFFKVKLKTLLDSKFTADVSEMAFNEVMQVLNKYQ
jgi:hypothetical protein